MCLQQLWNRSSYSDGGNYLGQIIGALGGGDLCSQSKVLYNFNQVSMRPRSHTSLLKTSLLRADSALITFLLLEQNISHSI